MESPEERCFVCLESILDCSDTRVVGCHCSLLAHGECVETVARYAKHSRCGACRNSWPVVVHPQLHYRNVTVFAAKLIAAFAYIFSMRFVVTILDSMLSGTTAPFDDAICYSSKFEEIVMWLLALSLIMVIRTILPLSIGNELIGLHALTMLPNVSFLIDSTADLLRMLTILHMLWKLVHSGSTTRMKNVGRHLLAGVVLFFTASISWKTVELACMQPLWLVTLAILSLYHRGWCAIVAILRSELDGLQYHDTKCYLMLTPT